MASSPESASTWNSSEPLPPMAPGSATTERNLSPSRVKMARVRLVHGVVTGLQRLLVEVERVRILHEEFARAHHAETRPALVAEFHLDLVEVHRQLAVALELVARDVGDDFFMRRPEAEVALVAVLEAQQFRAELAPSAGFHPQLGGNDAGHQKLECTGTIHFLAHDVLDLAHGAQARAASRCTGPRPACE